MQKKIFIANWKMNQSIAASVDFCTTHKTALQKLTIHADIVLCPSFPALLPMAHLLNNTQIQLGAQTCSIYPKGAYTGQVSAPMLKEVGCTYCIIGHSEQRKATGLSNKDVAEQAQRLLEVGIQPIVCIGEPKEVFLEDAAYEVLEAQLAPVIEVLRTAQLPSIIAYEPIWSIGTGIIPQQDYLEHISKWLTQKLKEELNTPWRLIYGGSVNPDTIASLRTVSFFHGFLIGDASLNFQKFEKIVS